MKDKKGKLRKLLAILDNGIEVKRGIEDKKEVKLELNFPDPKPDELLLKIEITLDPADHPELHNLRENISPIRIRQILEKDGLHPCRTSVSEIRPKRQNAFQSFDHKQNPSLDDELLRLEKCIHLFGTKMKDSPLGILFDNQPSCPYSCHQNTHK